MNGESHGEWDVRNQVSSVCKGMACSVSAIEHQKRYKQSIKIWPSKYEILDELVGSISLVKGGHITGEWR